MDPPLPVFPQVSAVISPFRPARFPATRRKGADLPPFALSALVAASWWAGQPVLGEMTVGGISAVLPEPLTEANFAALQESSPFLRSIGLSQSLVLTGVARIGDEVIATLHDLQTRESFLISEETNPQGWQLMEVRGDPSDLKSLTAQIKVAGSEVVSIRYEKIPPRPVTKGGGPSGGGRTTPGSGDPGGLSSDQAAEAKLAATNYRQGFDADGYPRQPPPEMVAKLSRMTVEQREGINRQMFQLHNRGLGMEERRPIYEKLVDRTLQSAQ